MNRDAEDAVVTVSTWESTVAPRGCTERVVLRQDPKAWEKGFKAGDSTVRAQVRCPYSAGTTQAWSWHSGYVEGDAKRQGFSYSRGSLSSGLPLRDPSSCSGES